MFTYFVDMCSGSSRKTEWDVIFVELPYKYALTWFEDTYGRDPKYVTCECCGPDFSIEEVDSLDSLKFFNDLKVTTVLRKDIEL